MHSEVASSASTAKLQHTIHNAFVQCIMCLWGKRNLHIVHSMCYR